MGHTNYEAAFYNISVVAKGGHLSESEWQQFITDVFNCPTMEEADNRNAHHVPVWRYRYYGDFDNTRLTPTSGAYHGSDLHMLFGNSDRVTGDPESAKQTQLKKTMQKAWASFAADPWHGLETVGWPAYNTTGKS